MKRNEMDNGSIKILIVDDDPVALSVIYGLIIEWGFSASKASNGEQAIKSTMKTDYDLIVMDVKMDGIDGIKAGQIITSKKRIPILFLTSISERDMIKEGIKKGGFGWLIKPINPSQLKSSVISSLERGREIKKLNQAILEKNTVGCAVGILMCKYGLNQKKSTEKLKSVARNNRKKMIDIAKQIIFNEEKIQKQQ